LRANQTNSLSIGGQAAALALFCTALTLMGSVPFIVFCLPPIVQAIEARSWVPVPCKIVSSGMSTSHRSRTSRRSRGTVYHIQVVYTYSYNGRFYQSNRYRFKQLNSPGGRAEKEQVVQRLLPGSTANCFVNPADPSQAVMDRDFNWDMFAEFIPLAFAGVGIAGILWSVHMRRRLRAV
jgi:hypothetical protein